MDHGSGPHGPLPWPFSAATTMRSTAARGRQASPYPPEVSAFDCITVALFGHPDPAIGDKLVVPFAPPIEPSGFRTGVYADDCDLPAILADLRPQVIFSFGPIERYPRLLAAPIDVRRRWVNITDDKDPGQLAITALNVFVDVATSDRFPQLPLVSVYTPTYRTGERLMRPLRSLIGQTYKNWEWVIYDDSPEDATFDQVRQIAQSDQRVKVFRGDRNCGVIGEVKRRLCGLARGRILVELDHDDELTDHCLADLVEAFARFPDAGFAYSDCAEIYDDGEPHTYDDGWGFGFGSYRREQYQGREFFVTNYPSVNAKTVRHIVGVPNHVRAWRRDAYERSGGFSPEIHVCDDYELLLRTFLTTRMVHVRRFGYIQYLARGGTNTHLVRNKEIQRLVRLFCHRYNAQIHDRLIELGLDDFMWCDGSINWNAPIPTPTAIANYELL
jgi:O-antigen biosynthesis protein